jgi:hypothetical protein
MQQWHASRDRWRERYLYICMHKCMYVCMYACMYIYMYIYIYIYIYRLSLSSLYHVHIIFYSLRGISRYLYIQYICMTVYMYVCMYIFIRAYTCIYICTYTCIIYIYLSRVLELLVICTHNMLFFTSYIQRSKYIQYKVEEQARA